MTEEVKQAVVQGEAVVAKRPFEDSIPIESDLKKPKLA